MSKENQISSIKTGIAYALLDLDFAYNVGDNSRAEKIEKTILELEKELSELEKETK